MSQISFKIGLQEPFVSSDAMWVKYRCLLLKLHGTIRVRFFETPDRERRAIFSSEMPIICIETPDRERRAIFSSEMPIICSTFRLLTNIYTNYYLAIQVPCEKENTKDYYPLIGDGLIINETDRPFWEESKWIRKILLIHHFRKYPQRVMPPNEQCEIK